MYVCMYVRTYVCMYVCMYVYKHVYIPGLPALGLVNIPCIRE